LAVNGFVSAERLRETFGQGRERRTRLVGNSPRGGECAQPRRARRFRRYLESSRHITTEPCGGVRNLEFRTAGSGSLQASDGRAAGGQVSREYVERFDNLSTTSSRGCTTPVLSTLHEHENNNHPQGQGTHQDLGPKDQTNDHCGRSDYPLMTRTGRAGPPDRRREQTVQTSTSRGQHQHDGGHHQQSRDEGRAHATPARSLVKR
jgi:hypothetical protein